MIKIKRSTDGQFFYIVTSRNGKVLVTSETYKRKRSAKHGASALASLLYGMWNDLDQLIIDETGK